MNSVDKYKHDLNEALAKVNNNSNYFASFDNVYIAKKLKEYLDNIAVELEKVKILVEEVEKK